MYVYNKITGDIICKIPDDQTIETIFIHQSPEFVSNLELVDYEMDLKRRDYRFYIVVNGEMVKRSEQEIEEIEKYGRVLTEGRRLDLKLRPKPNEIIKAEAFLETINILQEVGLI